MVRVRSLRAEDSGSRRFALLASANVERVYTRSSRSHKHLLSSNEFSHELSFATRCSFSGGADLWIMQVLV